MPFDDDSSLSETPVKIVNRQTAYPKNRQLFQRAQKTSFNSISSAFASVQLKMKKLFLGLAIQIYCQYVGSGTSHLILFHRRKR